MNPFALQGKNSEASNHEGSSRDEDKIYIGSKINKLERALKSNPDFTHIYDKNIASGTSRSHKTLYVPDYNKLGRQREDAAKETIELLHIVSDKASATEGEMPAIVWFNRAKDLSNRLGTLGFRHEALQLCTLGHDVIQKLASQNNAFFRSDLASSFDNMSVCLSEVGRREEALKHNEEALKIWRLLVHDRDIGTAFNPDLAASLNNISSCLSNMGRRREALESIEEAVRIFRSLSKDDPTAFNPVLATSLYNLSNRLSDMGKRKEALESIEEAVRIRRSLAEDDPIAFNPVLARSLNNMSNRLSDMGRRKEALETIEDAVRIRRSLAKDDPDRKSTRLNSSHSGESRMPSSA